MKKILLVLVTIFGLSCFLNAQSFQNPFPDTNDVTELGSSKQHYLDLKSSNTLKSANELVYLQDSIHGFTINADSVWEGTFKIEQSYDERGNLIGYLQKDWNDDAADFLNNYYDVWIYNGDNKQSEFYEFEWNPENTAWDTTVFAPYSYDENENLIKLVRYNWDAGSSAWINSFKRLYKYDENGNQVEYLFQRWDVANSIWYNSILYTYKYNTDGLKTEQVSQSWNRNDSVWKNSLFILYSYNDDDDATLSDYKKWDTYSEDWINNYLYTSTYAANGLKDLMIYQKWNSTDSVYQNLSRYFYEYDEFGNLIEYYIQNWDAENSTWKQYRKELRYYSQHDVTAAKILELENSIIIYPNPAENEISLSNITELSTVSIHDINGKLFIQRKVNTNNEVINVSQLPAGLYLLKISNQSGQQVAKFVKQ